MDVALSNLVLHDEYLCLYFQLLILFYAFRKLLEFKMLPFGPRTQISNSVHIWVLINHKLLLLYSFIACSFQSFRTKLILDWCLQYVTFFQLCKRFVLVDQGISEGHLSCQNVLRWDCLVFKHDRVQNELVLTSLEKVTLSYRGTHMPLIHLYVLLRLRFSIHSFLVLFGETSEYKW